MPNDSPLLAPPVISASDAIVRLHQIQTFVEETTPRGRHDGVACFNHMYLVVTTAVVEGIEQGFFEDDDFVALLDVTFVNRYLAALRADAGGSAAPRSWRALLESRSHPRITAVQFALAGMNAHINFDLCSAVVATVLQLGAELGSGTQREDFERINRVLAAEMREIRHHLQTRFEDWIDDHVLGDVDDILAKWSIDAARDTAWDNGQLLWCIRDDPFPTGVFLGGLDRLVGLAGRGLLVHH
jgi:hypothetical protein